MTRAEIIRDSTYRLHEAGWEDARNLAELLLIHAMGVERYHIYLNPHQPVGGRQKQVFDRMLARSLKHEPLEYITGQAEFFGLELEIHPGVLIPRPETELLIDHAKRVSGDGVRRAMEIGCGSGALTLALFEQRIAQEVVAVDISLQAIKTTATNASRYGFFKVDPKKDERASELPDNAVLYQRRSLDPLTKREHIDRLWLILGDAFSVTFRPPIHPVPLILSNPPYVTLQDWENLPPHIKDHEPKEALIAGEDGFDIHRKLTRRLKNWLSTGGAFVGEIGAGQGEEVVKLHQSWAKRVELHQDYADLDRIVIAFK